MALLDLLGRKTALRILWELKDAPLNFRALAEAAETNPGVLNTRLHELRQAGIVELTENGYELSTGGAELVVRLMPLTAWADSWARRTQKPSR